MGVNKFVFEADPPDLSRIPNSEILGVTVILLTCSYDNREFVRVGYYVNNEYTDEALKAEPPAKPVIEKVQRSILAEKPRVTRFAIKWDSEESAPAEYPPEQPEADAAEDDGARYGADEEEEEEVAEESTKVGVDSDAKGEGAEMATAEVANGTAEQDGAASEAGSEDLEAESSGSDDEDEEDEEDEEEAEEQAEVEGDADEEMGDGQAAPAPTATEVPEQHQHQQQAHQADVMVH